MASMNAESFKPFSPFLSIYSFPRSLVALLMDLERVFEPTLENRYPRIE